MRAVWICGVCSAFALLTGCAADQAVRVQTSKVAVPIVCSEKVPERPVMPTEQLEPGVALDSFVAAALAEIERREGYEVRLRTALMACTNPLRAKE